MRIILASTSPRRRELIKRITTDFECVPSLVDEQAVEERVEKGGVYVSEAGLAALMVRALSREKARDVFDRLEDKENVLVIGADTVVCLENEILGKPKDRADAVRMLRAQSREPQRVITGVSFIYCGSLSADRCCASGNNCCADGKCAGRAFGNDADSVIDGLAGCCPDGQGKEGTIIRTFTEETLVYFHPLDEAQEARIQAYCDTEEPYDKAGAYGIQLGGNALVERYEGDFDNIVGFPVKRIKEELQELLCCNCNNLT